MEETLQTALGQNQAWVAAIGLVLVVTVICKT